MTDLANCRTVELRFISLLFSETSRSVLESRQLPSYPVYTGSKTSLWWTQYLTSTTRLRQLSSSSPETSYWLGSQLAVGRIYCLWRPSVINVPKPRTQFLVHFSDLRTGTVFTVHPVIYAATTWLYCSCLGRSQRQFDSSSVCDNFVGQGVTLCCDIAFWNIHSPGNNKA